MYHVTTPDGRSGSGKNAPEARRNCGIKVRDDHTLWLCTDSESRVEGDGIVCGCDHEVSIEAKWRAGKRCKVWNRVAKLEVMGEEVQGD